MKAAILYGDRDIRIGHGARPARRARRSARPSQFAGICGTDLHIYRGEFHDRVRFPAIQGHEFGGVIEEVGADVRRFAVGDRVVVDPIISCHGCPACLTGRTSTPAARSKLLGVDLDGGFGQYVAAPATHVFAAARAACR